MFSININPPVKKLIKSVTPPIVLALFRKAVAKSHPVEFTGPYASWQEAVANSGAGWNSEEVFNKVTASALKVKRGEAIYERDSVIFDQIQYSWPLLAALLWVIAREDGHLRICDFGGALGTSYFQNRKFFTEFSHVRWNIVEQAEFVTRGRNLIQDERLRFYPTVEACLKECSCDVLLLSGVLQNLEDPYRAVTDLIGYGFRYIIIARTPFSSKDDDVLTVQHVPHKIYQASYPVWFFSERKFLSHLQTSYELIEHFEESTTQHLGELQAQMKGFILCKSRRSS
jgi:putative methyltransferase (TIGR04325 family)